MLRMFAVSLRYDVNNICFYSENLTLDKCGFCRFKILNPLILTWYMFPELKLMLELVHFQLLSELFGIDPPNILSDQIEKFTFSDFIIPPNFDEFRIVHWLWVCPTPIHFSVVLF